MKLDLLIEHNKTVKLNIDTSGKFAPGYSTMIKVFNKVKHTNGFDTIKYEMYGPSFPSFRHSTTYIIGNNKWNIEWVKDTYYINFRSLKINLKALKDEDKKYNSIIFKDKNKFNLYDFAMYLLVSGYTRGSIVHLEEIDEKMKDLYLAINDVSMLLLTNNYNICQFANSETMEIS